MTKILKALIAGIMATLSCSQLCRYGCAAEQSEYNFDELLNAIAIVESGGDPKVVGDGGKAIGLFQLHKICVDDVNRILGWPAYSYNDRWKPYDSRCIATVYLQHYGKAKSIEAMARIHNGGPDGWRKKSTVKYWLKVKAELEKK